MKINIVKWMKSGQEWWTGQAKVLAGVAKQAAIPTSLSLVWAFYNTAAAVNSSKPWAWNTFIASFGSALAILSILSSQWFRVSKQIRDQDNFGRLNTGVEDLKGLMEALHDRQNISGYSGAGADWSRPDFHNETARLEANDYAERRAYLPPRRMDELSTPEEYFSYAHDLLQAGQDYPAAWLAAQGFERTVRDVALKLDTNPNGSLTSTIRSLPNSSVDRALVEELILLARVRNNLAHPTKSHAISFESEIQLPSRVIQSFEIGARHLRSALV